MHGVFLQAIKAMFHVVKQKVKVNGNLGEEVSTFLGVKQGDPLSTDLFGILIEVLHNMLVVLGAGDVGVQIGSSRIPDLMFVDDISETRRSIQLGLNIIELFEDIFRMKVNITKTEVLLLGYRVNMAQEESFIYKEVEIKVVLKAKYLGGMWSTINTPILL